MWEMVGSGSLGGGGAFLFDRRCSLWIIAGFGGVSPV